jgi:hypothetical protein
MSPYDSVAQPAKKPAMRLVHPFAESTPRRI